MARDFGSSPEGAATWSPEESGEEGHQRPPRRGRRERTPRRDLGVELAPETRRRLEELQRRKDRGEQLEEGDEEQYRAFVEAVGGSEQWERVWQSTRQENGTGEHSEPAAAPVEAEPVTAPTDTASTETSQPQVEEPVATGEPTEAVPEIVEAPRAEVAARVAASEPRRGARGSRPERGKRRERRPEITAETDPTTLDQKGLYQLRSVIEKMPKGSDQAAALKRMEAEAHRRGDEARGRTKKAVSSEPEAISGTAEAPAAEETLEDRVAKRAAGLEEYSTEALEDMREVLQIDLARNETRLNELEASGQGESNRADALRIAVEDAKESIAARDLILTRRLGKAPAETPETTPSDSTATTAGPEVGEVLEPAPGVAEQRSAEMRAAGELMAEDAEGSRGTSPEGPTNAEVREAGALIGGAPGIVERVRGWLAERPAAEEPGQAEALDEESLLREWLGLAPGERKDVPLDQLRVEAAQKPGLDAWLREGRPQVSDERGDLREYLGLKPGEGEDYSLDELRLAAQRKPALDTWRTSGRTFVREGESDVPEFYASGAGGEKGPEEPTPAEVREAELSPLAQKREAYAKALRSQSNILRRRAKKGDLEKTREEYQAAIQENVQSKIEEIRAELGGAAGNPEQETLLNKKLTELILGSRFEEEEALRSATKEAADKTWGQKFQYFWKKHAKARMIVSGVLLGGSLVAGATGNIPLALVIQGARVPLSGVGTTFGAEAMMEMWRGKKGATKELTEARIKDREKFSDEELERRLAAHDTTYTENDAEFGKRRKFAGFEFKGWKPKIKTREDMTGQMLLAEYQARKKDQLMEMAREMKAEGKTPDQVVAELLQANLEDQQSRHDDLERQRHADRRFSTVKWVGAAALGVTAAAFSMGGAMRLFGKAHEMSEAGHAKGLASGATAAHEQTQAAPDHTGVAAPDKPASAPGVQTHAPEHKSWAEHRMQESGVRTPTQAELDEMKATKAAYVAEHPEAAQAAAQSAEAAETAGSAVETVKQGDSVWKLLERQLHERMGPKFDQLDEARKTYMIDSLKDKVVANPQEFGLTDPNELQVGDKVDFSHLFEGDHSVDLNEVHTEAQHLNQHSVDSILQHNKELNEWVASHPHDALASHLSEDLSQTIKDATAELPSGDAAWVKMVAKGMREKLLSDLCEQDPERYAQLHADDPDTFPSLAGVNETTPTEAAAQVEAPEPAVEPVTLPDNFDHSLNEWRKSVMFLKSHASDESYVRIMQKLDQMDAHSALKKGTVERMIDQMEGGTQENAKKMGKAIREMLKHLPKKEIHSGELVGNVLKRIDATLRVSR